jgi:hypothetical protein
MIIALARETGWPEDFITGTLPWPRALLYWHAIAFGNGVWTVAPAPPVEDQLAALGI